MTVYSGYTSETKKHLLLDAGCVFKNYDITTDTFATARASKLIGATSGGCEFNVKPDIRQIEVDGIKGKAKGLEVVDSVDVSLTVNFIELTPDLLKLSLGSAAMSEVTVGSGSAANYKLIEGNTEISDSDYLTNITYIGTISGSAQPVIIVIENSLCTDGIKLSMEDKKESVLAAAFYGHYDDDGTGNFGNPPYKIYYPIISSSSSNG